MRTVNTIALLSSLQAVANPHQSHAAKEVAFTHLLAQFRATLPREFGSGMGSKVSKQSPNLDELISALGVVADPAALPSNKAKALDKLMTYFKSLSKSAPSELSSAIKVLASRVAGAERMAGTRATIRALMARVEKGTAPRRPPMTTQKDSVVLAIERAERTVLRSLGKDIPPSWSQSTATDHIERAAANTLRTIGK